MPAALLAAGAARGEGRGGQHEEAGRRIEVTGLAGCQSIGMRAKDLGAMRMVKWQPARVRFLERSASHHQASGATIRIDGGYGRCRLVARVPRV